MYDPDDYFNSLGNYDDAPQEFGGDDGPVMLSSNDFEPEIASGIVGQSPPQTQLSAPSSRKRAKLGDDPRDWYLRADLSQSREERESGERDRVEAAALDAVIERLDRGRGGPTSAVDASMEASSSSFAPAAAVFALPPTGAADWRAVSAPDGAARLYVCATDSAPQWMPPRSSDGLARDLLSTSFAEVKTEALLFILNKRLEAEGSMEMVDTIPPASLEEEFAMFHSTTNVQGEAEAKESLWVDKYRPRMFTDLLSDDGLNRTMITWLKQWDECVFKRKAPAPRQPMAGGAAKFKRRIDDADMFGKLDQHRRPQYKMALLSGPAGLGKTTLAHVLARLAGYNVVEMNASDDRSVEHFERRCEDALTATRTLDREPRPNCLVIDEIDGAPATSVNYLVSLVQGKAGKKNRKKILRRPIICICNELYSPALRELRKVAFVLQFGGTSVRRLLERLGHICRDELVRVDRQALELLAERTRQDIRSCLNSLQFLSLRDKFGRVTLAELQSMSLGDKDADRSLFDVWRALFDMPRHGRKCENMSEGARVALLRDYLQRVDFDKLSQGVFENYLLSRSRSAGVREASEGLEWFVLMDRLDKLVSTSQNYSLWRYHECLPIAFHLLFASTSCPRLIFPQAHFMAERKMQRSRETLAAVMGGSSSAAALRSSVGAQGLALEVLPRVTDLLRPAFRPVNAQLYSAKERAQLRAVVDVMIHFNLTYRQQRSADGHYEFELEPPVSEVVSYKLEEVSNERTLSYACKQMIGREVELERVKRSEAALSGRSGKPCQTPKQRVDVPRSMVAPSDQSAPKATLASIFGFRQPKRTSRGPSAAVQCATPCPIWYKYNEGYTNAVRRNIRMRDLC